MEYLYDACSDYSLCDKVSESSKQLAKSRAYKWKPIYINDVSAMAGYHIKTGELHYIKADSDNLSGRYV